MYTETTIKREDGSTVKIVVELYIGFGRGKHQWNVRFWEKKKFKRDFSTANSTVVTPQELYNAQIAFWESIKPQLP